MKLLNKIKELEEIDNDRDDFVSHSKHNIIFYACNLNDIGFCFL